ncbi:hypothetical protein H0A36_27020 [Endozoicomonas sp. SM1973]|uniref:Uncharacterized protein n=1 Tax=Spartinivicinus marinus TaxID=2994442 RepID=A0A853IHY7_9GAMM|nr:hypothetical protein [Spartinivicinus marinus]MCX4025627.1 hypothetical protein [Spartinivicinus marinus]NYZ69671.1 hypothetical protein [Spartinivicinus marinus]
MVRQKVEPKGQYRRQVHARPTTSFASAAPITGSIDPQSNALIRGLTSFTQSLAGAVRQQRQATFESQALTAHANKSAYIKEASEYLENTPDGGLGDPAQYQEELGKLREKYFSSITHGRLKESINTEIDAWNSGHLGALQQNAAAKQRLELGQNVLESKVKELGALLDKGEINQDQYNQEISTVFKYARESEAIAMSEEDVGRFAIQLQELNGRNPALAKALENSELLSVGHRATLKKQRAEAEAMQPAERQLKQLEVQPAIEKLMAQNQLTRAWFKPYVAKGIFTAGQVQTYLNQQKKLQEQAKTNFNYLAIFGSENIKHLQLKDQQKALQFSHHEYIKQYGSKQGQDLFDTKLRKNGIVYKPYQATLQAGLPSLGAVINSEKDIPKNTIEAVNLYKRLKAMGMVDLYLSNEEATAYAAIDAYVETGDTMEEALNKHLAVENDPNTQHLVPTWNELNDVAADIRSEMSPYWGDAPPMLSGLEASAKAMYTNLIKRKVSPEKAKELVVNRLTNTYDVIDGQLINKRLLGFNYDRDDLTTRFHHLIDHYKRENQGIDADEELALEPMEGGFFRLVDKESGFPYFDNKGKAYRFSYQQMMGQGEDTVSKIMKNAKLQALQEEIKNRNQIRHNKAEARRLFKYRHIPYSPED